MDPMRGRKGLAVVPLVFLLFLCLVLVVNCRRGNRLLDVHDPVGRITSHSYVQGREKSLITATRRRSLSGLGSSPPDCTARCGECLPCNPVQVAVPVPPGTPANGGYYPEQWRCQCGNRFFKAWQHQPENNLLVGFQ